MKMSRSAWIHISLAIVIAIAAVFLIRVHNAGGNKTVGSVQQSETHPLS